MGFASQPCGPRSRCYYGMCTASPGPAAWSHGAGDSASHASRVSGEQGAAASAAGASWAASPQPANAKPCVSSTLSCPLQAPGPAHTRSAPQEACLAISELRVMWTTLHGVLLCCPAGSPQEESPPSRPPVTRQSKTPPKATASPDPLSLPNPSMHQGNCPSTSSSDTREDPGRAPARPQFGPTQSCPSGPKPAALGGPWWQMGLAWPAKNMSYSHNPTRGRYPSAARQPGSLEAPRAAHVPKDAASGSSLAPEYQQSWPP